MLVVAKIVVKPLQAESLPLARRRLSTFEETDIPFGTFRNCPLFAELKL